MDEIEELSKRRILKNKKIKTIYCYNVCDHEKCFEEVESQAVSYTTGVPAMIGSLLILIDLILSIKELDISPDDAFRLIVSGGLSINEEENIKKYQPKTYKSCLLSVNKSKYKNNIRINYSEVKLINQYFQKNL